MNISGFHSGKTFPAETSFSHVLCEKLPVFALHNCGIIAFDLRICPTNAIVQLSHHVAQMECGYSKPNVPFGKSWPESRFFLRGGFDECDY